MSAPIYRAYRLRIGSRVELPELPAADDGPATVSFDVSREGRLPGNLAWTSVWTFPDGRPWLLAAHQAGVRFLRFVGCTDFRVDAARGEVRAYPVPGTPDESVRHLLLDQVLPLLLAEGGDLVLHASAVAIGGRAIAFAGSSGSGKSTLAAVFAGHGATLLADDATMLERRAGNVRVVPGYAGLRLRPDTLAALTSLPHASVRVAHYSDKHRVTFARDDGTLRPIPLARLYALQWASPAARVRLTALSRRERLMTLVRLAFRLELADPARLGREFDRLAVESGAVAIARLEVPRALLRLADVRAAIGEDLLTVGRPPGVGPVVD